MHEDVEFTNMCMVCSGDQVLVIDRKKQDWPGVAFPGGHVELGESFTDAVIREVWEETGLTIESPQICGIKDWQEDGTRYVVLLYKAAKFRGTLQSSEEGEVWWADMDKISELKLAYHMEETLRLFTEDGISEFFYRKEGENWVYDLK